MPNGGFRNCEYCNHFDIESQSCVLRKENIAIPEWTTCDSCNEMHQVPKGTLWSIVCEVKNNAGKYTEIPYYLGSRPDTVQNEETNDTIIVCIGKEGNKMEFSTADGYEDFYEGIYDLPLILLGSLAGDIIGSVFEMHNIKTTKFNLFSEGCRYTDDSIMTLAVANKCILDTTYENEFQSFGRKYHKAGYGTGFKEWIFSDKQKPYNSYGNGSAMRVSPIAYVFENLDKVLDEAKKSAEITHNHPEGIKGAQAVAAAVFMARIGSSKKEIKKYISEKFGYNLDRRIKRIRKIYQFDLSCQGTVPEAIIAFLESKDFESSIRLAVSIGGDSDTIASITGAISEAFYKEIPKHIKQSVIEILPDDLLKVLIDFSTKYQKLSTRDGLRENIPIDNYLDILLERSKSINKSLKEHIINRTDFSGDEEILDFEAKVFGLWVVSLCIEDSRIKDMFHQRFCTVIGLDEEEIMTFYSQLKIRYDNYNYSYGNWIKNPQGGSLIGRVMTEILVYQNPSFSIQETIPLVDGDIALEMFIYFAESFKATMSVIIKIKENYYLPVLN